MRELVRQWCRHEECIHAVANGMHRGAVCLSLWQDEGMRPGEAGCYVFRGRFGEYGCNLQRRACMHSFFLSCSRTSAARHRRCS